jgi:glyoxylase I family protein
VTALQLLTIHHVAIICSNYEVSKSFYSELLGLSILRETWRAERQSWKCDLMLGPIQIELFTFPHAPPRPSRPEALGLRHLAVAVSDLDAAVAHLTKACVAVEPVRVDELTDRRFAFFTDPDGLPLELYESASVELLHRS